MSLEAVIFDFDGVVVDSHHAHERSWFELAAELGETLTYEQFHETFGQRNESIIPWLGWADAMDHAKIRRLGDRKEVLYRAILEKEGIVPLPGVVALLKKLGEAGIPTAVGTSAPRANIECVFRLLGLADDFREISASEDVSRGKPDPEVFLKAAAKLKVKPENCVVIEDAHAGIRAARAGGMKAVAVTTTHDADALAREMPDLVVDSLDELDVERLGKLFAC
ncbi:MAG: HAD family phosphatase [Luteolibacter sp.]